MSDDEKYRGVKFFNSDTVDWCNSNEVKAALNEADKQIDILCTALDQTKESWKKSRESLADWRDQCMKLEKALDKIESDHWDNEQIGDIASEALEAFRKWKEQK